MVDRDTKLIDDLGRALEHMHGLTLESKPRNAAIAADRPEHLAAFRAKQVYRPDGYPACKWCALIARWRQHRALRA